MSANFPLFDKEPGSAPAPFALINGTAAHTVEVDDIYREAIYHPGAPTIAAAWAVGQETRASGMEALQAVVAGYEISTRIGATMGQAHYKYWHNTGTVGTVGSFGAGLQQCRNNSAGLTRFKKTSTTLISAWWPWVNRISKCW